MVIQVLNLEQIRCCLEFGGNKEGYKSILCLIIPCVGVFEINGRIYQRMWQRSFKCHRKRKMHSNSMFPGHFRKRTLSIKIPYTKSRQSIEILTSLFRRSLESANSVPSITETDEICKQCLVCCWAIPCKYISYSDFSKDDIST